MAEDHYAEQSVSVRRHGDEVVLILSLEAADILTEFLVHREPRYATSWQRVGIAVQSAAHRLGAYREPVLSRSEFLRARWLTEVPASMDLSLPLVPFEPPSVIAVTAGAAPPVAAPVAAGRQNEEPDEARATGDAEVDTVDAAVLVRAAVLTAAATTAAAARASRAARAEEATRAAAAVADVVSQAATAVQADADHQAEAVAALASSTAAAVARQVLPGHEVEERERASTVAASTALAAVETARVTALAAARVAEAAAKAAAAAAAAARDAAVILELEVANAAQEVQHVADRAALRVGAANAAAELVPVKA